MSELSVYLGDGVHVVRAAKQLDTATAKHLTVTVNDLVATGRSRVVVDLSHTAHVDSSGLGALVSCLKKTRQAGGDLRIASPTDHVRNVLESTRLNRVLRPSETVQTASAAF